MNKNQQDNHYQQTDSLSRQKRNEDYTKQRPNPKDSNQNKNHQTFNDEEMENINRQIAAKTSGGTTSNAWNHNYYEEDVDHGTYYDSRNQDRKEKLDATKR